MPDPGHQRGRAPGRRLPRRRRALRISFFTPNADSEQQDRRQAAARNLVQISRESTTEFAMKRLLAGLLALPLSALAQNGAPPEPPLESNPVGTWIFVVLFVGFCV